MSIEFFKEQFDRVQSANGSSRLNTVRQNAFSAFNKMGVPTVKNEEWKYTRISGLFNKEYQFPFTQIATLVTEADVNAVRLPGYEQAHELVFINGVFSFPLSKILRSEGLVVQPLEEAAGNEYATIVAEHLGHSSRYLTDGINALNTAFVYGGVFIDVKKRYSSEHPVYIYNITDSRSGNILSQPRSLVHINEKAEVQLVETFATLGLQESFTNQVVEIVLEKEARLEYYKIQNDASHTNQVSTTHIRQVGKSFVHTVTISLNGNIVRNNLNIILEAAHCESHLYGLYLQKGTSHIDNHTLVDNAQPNCLSNELYKGIMDENATGVFNGKILVQQLAQKTNAYQSNKNILLSPSASINAKPQLEIFADDVKCSHGCTVGSLDEEAMFYLRSRGVSENSARSLLLHAYADDILGMIKPAGIRTHIEQLINERLEISEV
jgi:Fe-S cluster assembly protein SufD